MSEAHSIAISSFNSNHTLYDQLRPSFSSKIVNQFLVDLNLGSVTDGIIKFDNEKTILELAAGTGKFTKNLVENGWSDLLIVVEPSTGMLESFERNFPLVKTYQGSSYSIPLLDSSVDAVIVAQGFHWFSDENSLREINRVLKPNGTFGCIWNLDAPSVSQTLHDPIPHTKIFYENIPSGEGLFKNIDNVDNVTQLVQEFFKLHPWCVNVSDYIYSFDIKVPQYRHGKWKELLSKENRYFSPIETENFLLYVSQIKPEEVYKYWETRSYITDLSPEEKENIKRNVSSLIENATDDDKITVNHISYLLRCMGTHSITCKAK